MDKRVETGREFWRAVLLAGGATAIPRWTLDPAPGVAEHVADPDDDLAAAVRRLADGLELPLHSVALAAHAKVLAALSGEQDVVTGYAAGARWPAAALPAHDQPCSWRSLLQDTARVESDLLLHRALPGRRAQARARRGRAGVRDRVRPDRQPRHRRQDH